MSLDASHGSEQLDTHRGRPKLAVWKFASCDGCQLSILNLEDDLLALGQALDIAYFPEASSDMSAGPYDIALVEGSITTKEDAHRVLAVRQSGGVGAHRDFDPRGDRLPEPLDAALLKGLLALTSRYSIPVSCLS